MRFHINHIYLLDLWRLHSFGHLLDLVPKESKHQHCDCPMLTERLQQSVGEKRTAFLRVLFKPVGIKWVIIMKYYLF